MLRIEPASLHDLPGCYRVCIGTARQGEDATELHGDPDLLGHVYVGPYLARGQGTQLVVVDDGGVCGYLLSTDDTDAHHDWAEVHWWPPLRARYADLDADPGADPRDAWLTRQLHRPPRPPAELTAAYPAHLHIDLLARARGVGLGRVLIDRLLADLRGRGVPAVHLVADPANHNAVAFYEHLGFEVLARLPDDTVMGLRLDR